MLKTDVTPPLAQPLDRGARVCLDAVVGRLVDVRPVLELVVAGARAGGAPEVVERDRSVPALGEAKGQLLVEVVEAADVREDDHARRRLAVGRREEGRELVSVGGRQGQRVV